MSHVSAAITIGAVIFIPVPMGGNVSYSGFSSFAIEDMHSTDGAMVGKRFGFVFELLVHVAPDFFTMRAIGLVIIRNLHGVSFPGVGGHGAALHTINKLVTGSGTLFTLGINRTQCYFN